HSVKCSHRVHHDRRNTLIIRAGLLSGVRWGTQRDEQLLALGSWLLAKNSSVHDTRVAPPPRQCLLSSSSSSASLRNPLGPVTRAQRNIFDNARERRLV